MPEETKPDGEKPSSEPTPSTSQDQYFDDPYSYEAQTHTALTTTAEQPGQVAAAAPSSSGAPPFVPTDPDSSEDDEEDDGMLRMSFLEHLEELRSRIIKAIAGLGIAFLATIIFSNDLWEIVQQPLRKALDELKIGDIIALGPMDAFMTIWVKLPLLASLFLASPWVLYQVWAFIAPGLYKKERRFAVPFVLCSAGLFILGGCFAYFVAFRFGLTFLLSIAAQGGVKPAISLVEYFDLFVNVILGIGIVFELPILVFFLILLRITTPQFLMANSRYAILGIVVLAAIVTPTPDVVNLMIFSLPMIFLYFIGVFVGWIFVMRRDNLAFPWGKFFLYVILPLVLTIGTTVFLLVTRFGYRLVPMWPFLSK